MSSFNIVSMASMVAGVITHRVHETTVFTLLIFCPESNDMVYVYIYIYI